MPKINHSIYIDVTPEKFLNACSNNELMELEILMQSPAIQSRIRYQEEMNNERRIKELEAESSKQEVKEEQSV